jgi:hypothetical protein
MIPTATDIAAWANKRDAQGLMPILLRRLIHGSVPSIRSISFPGGDSVQLGGFDGEVDVEIGNAWVPEGKSVWESGCNKGVKGKADGDAGHPKILGRNAVELKTSGKTYDASMPMTLNNGLNRHYQPHFG